VESVIGFAMAQLGDPYVWAAAGPDAWDCSGLTMQAWGQAGVYLPHYSAAQYDAGTPVSFSELRRGDLIFWSGNGSSSGIYHVALYIGGGQMVHAPNSNTVVKISDMFYMGTPFGYARV
jgi:cell wall-associated NlpC family hydrolase